MFEIKFLDHKKKVVNDGVFAWSLQTAKKSGTIRLNKTGSYFWAEIWYKGEKKFFKFKYPTTNKWLEVTDV